VTALRQYWFPLFFLLTCVPWPSKVDEWVTQALQRGVARATVEVVGLFDIPALQHGSVLEISTGSVGIDEACSGIRSLQTSLMLALLLGELFLLRLRKRMLLLPAGILVALIANVGRTSFLTLSAARQGMDRMNAWHGLAGIAVVGIVMGVLWVLAWLIREKPKEFVESEVKAQGSGAANQRSEDSVQGSEFRVQSVRHLPAGVLVLCCLWIPITEVLTWTWYHWPGKGPVAAARWTIQWPTNESGFVQGPLAKRTADILRCTENADVSWTDQYGNKWNWIRLYWPPERNLNIYVGGHNPEMCMSGGGSAFLKKVQPVAVELGDVSMRFNHRLFQQQGQLLHVFQGTWEPFVPQTGQRLFGDNTLEGRVRNVLERRLIRGGITLEIGLSGPASPEDAARLVRELMKKMVIETHAGEVRRPAGLWPKSALRFAAPSVAQKVLVIPENESCLLCGLVLHQIAFAALLG